MKRIAIVIVFVFLLGILAGAAGFAFFAPKDPSGNKIMSVQAVAQASAAKKEASCLDAAMKAAKAFKDGDYNALADLAHPKKGVVFVPYSTVDKQKNLNFTADQIRKFGTDKTKYIWGLTDGEGAPIELTAKDYIAKYVYSKDYLSASVIGLNTVAKTGNSLENVKDVFPDASFVEFHIPGEDKKFEGLDWSSLKLVFELYEGDYRLVAVIHSQWTI